MSTLRKNIMTECLNCSKETKNPKFCSRNCAATFNNKSTPKRTHSKICDVCGEKAISYRHTKCKDHFEENKTRVKTKTIGEYRQLQSVKNKHPSWLHAHIRNFARSWLKHLTKLPCAKCGYDKHVELAHIKAVTDFTDNALLSEVNSENNVIQLCPNCHWEFDNLPR